MIGSEIARRELRRTRARALGLVVATYLATLLALVIAAPLDASPDLWGLALFLSIVMMAPLAATFTWLLMRRRFWPGLQALQWSNGSADAAWEELDGDAPPTDVDEALERLAGRDDDDSVAMRAAWLASDKRTADLRATLDAWRSGDPVNAARRARMASTLALLEGTTDDLAAAWEAASLIPDPSRRVELQARVCIEDARRRAEDGDDPFPRLVEAQRLLGTRAGEYDTDDDRRVRRRARWMVAASGIVPAVIFGAIGLAAWSGMLG
jgi:hypothetical protein